MPQSPVDVQALVQAIECAGRRRDVSELAGLAGIFHCLRQRCHVLAAQILSGAGREEPVADLFNLKVHEAARLTGMSSRWLYEHAPELPYAKQHGRCWRFSRAGIVRAQGKR
jgi:hypothetical protein